MIPSEPPFRPSTELQNAWLTERPAGIVPIQIPDNLEGMNELMIAVREGILKRLVDGSPFGIEILSVEESLEDAAQQRRQLEHEARARWIDETGKRLLNSRKKNGNDGD